MFQNRLFYINFACFAFLLLFDDFWIENVYSQRRTALVHNEWVRKRFEKYLTNSAFSWLSRSFKWLIGKCYSSVYKEDSESLWTSCIFILSFFMDYNLLYVRFLSTSKKTSFNRIFNALGRKYHSQWFCRW